MSLFGHVFNVWLHVAINKSDRELQSTKEFKSTMNSYSNNHSTDSSKCGHVTTLIVTWTGLNTYLFGFAAVMNYHTYRGWQHVLKVHISEREREKERAVPAHFQTAFTSDGNSSSF